jgi:predicted DNA-binding transcriptional regulator YafY
MTTRDLGSRLEVSRRTVLRDVEALSAAGVPVYAERGRAGGIVLLPGARLNVAHLDPPEQEALALAGLDVRRRAELGVAAVYETAVRKLAAGRRSDEPHLADLVVVEQDGWLAAEHGGAVDVADLALALRARSRLRLHYRRSGSATGRDVVVDPYGLAAKAGRWYLVADHDGRGRLYAVARIAHFEPLDESVRHRDGVTLRSAWEAHRTRIQDPGDMTVTARLRGDRVDLARRILGSRLADVAPAIDGWCTVAFRVHRIEGVVQLLQFGHHVEVMSPPEARRHFAETAAAVAAAHA